MEKYKIDGTLASTFNYQQNNNEEEIVLGSVILLVHHVLTHKRIHTHTYIYIYNIFTRSRLSHYIYIV